MLLENLKVILYKGTIANYAYELSADQVNFNTGIKEGEPELTEKRANYTIQCKTCRHTFIIQVRSYIDPANNGAILNHVYELSADGTTNYGQLGHFVTTMGDD